MDGQLWLDWISRFTHIATAITLIGGSIFTAFILRPAATGLEPTAHEALATSVTGRWKRFVHIGILLFLISGFYNYFRAMELHRGDGLYHALVGIKMLLALGVFFIAAALVGRSAKLESLRRRRDLWLRVLILLAAVIVGISGFVKVRGGSAIPTESALTE
ncbi:hypothetical protein [Roseimaritima sediminicola]|uniref:hypothetical protein n=1 Tax=Roseimaritima sediminicola TaxID=2662066 RepID=UPI00129851A2|nr:hypothetical protein [Roseimaritima sediminicola]